MLASVSAPVCLVTSLLAAWLLFLPRPVTLSVRGHLCCTCSALSISVLHDTFLVFYLCCFVCLDLFVVCSLVQCPSSAFLYPFLCQLIPFSPTTERHSHLAVGCPASHSSSSSTREEKMLFSPAPVTKIHRKGLSSLAYLAGNRSLFPFEMWVKLERNKWVNVWHRRWDLHIWMKVL